jgi:hypothetical protein
MTQSHAPQAGAQTHPPHTSRQTQAIVIPPDGPFRAISLEERDGSHLDQLQELVGGYIEAMRIPPEFDRTGRATCYINEDGKYTEACALNRRATDFLVPGVGLFFGDYIAGAMVLVGFDPETGEHLPELPEDVVRRAKLIAEESGAGWESEDQVERILSASASRPLPEGGSE